MVLKGNPARNPPTVGKREEPEPHVRLKQVGSSVSSKPEQGSARRQLFQNVPLTICHESHNGMRGATQVGRCTLIGYDSKQGNGAVRRETKHSSQHQDPDLQGQGEVALRISAHNCLRRKECLALSQAMVSSHPHPTPNTAGDTEGSEPAPGAQVDGAGEVRAIPPELDVGCFRICTSWTG